jgi:hypothetical protein
MNKSVTVFSIANVVGMLCFMGFTLGAQHLAVAEQRDSYDAGDIFGFLAIVAPVLLLCLLANIAWWVMAIVAVIQRRGYQSGIAFLVVCALWGGVVALSMVAARLPANSSFHRTASGGH